jgi:hypothetical protein
MSRDNSGSLSKNQRKEKETHPDYKGKATIGGIEYWISGWKKENDSGPWLSLAFEVKDAKPAARTAPPAKRFTREDDPAF